jgi:hypothetical protein
MLRILILPVSIYLVKVKMHAIESRIKRMETQQYLNLEGRIEVGRLKKILTHLQDQEAALHFSLSL